MSYIQFESARAKDKARQELREVREQILKEAKKRAEENANYDVKRALKGEVNWMLPSVEKKIELKNKEIKKYKKRKDKKGSKKTKKRSSKKRKYSSSDTHTDSSDSDSTSSSSEEEKKKRRKSKKCKKSGKLKKSLSSDNEEIKRAKESCENVKEHVEPITRDSWMTSPLILKTYVKEKKENELNGNENTDAYDPTKSTQEINPYWKITGTGLPSSSSFLKPKDDDDHDIQPMKSDKSLSSATKTSTKAWRKERAQNTSPRREKKSTVPSDESMSSSGDDNGKYETESKTNFLTDQQMNELGAKLLKAELIGNMSLAEELRQKMETARKQRSAFKELQKQSIFENQSTCDKRVKEDEEHIILTHTDKAGCTRPLPVHKVTDRRDKRNQRHMKTHNEYGERVRYFADDDRYSLKEMFEKEKFTTASDANLQYANIASKHKNPNDDMEDIFAENICKDDSVRAYQKEYKRAIREHQNTEKVLDNCDKCFDSKKMQKEHLVCVGDKVYLALPWYQGLQEGHCVIIPNQHVSCCTQLDEDTWSEINEFRKALTRMFTAQRKDVIFFEIANRLHKRPHLVIHCIPIRESDGEMAPFYFKKAIEESEHDWCINKQLVSLRHKSLLSCIPKGLPYFWVNFGMDTGFAHVIEDEDRFPPNFAQEIIGGMLNLDARKWRNLKKEQNIITKVKLFAEMWKKYDCTV